MLSNREFIFVLSRYSSRWKGIVLDYENRTGAGRLYTCLILLDNKGNKMRKRIIKIQDEAWCKEIEKFDISWVDKNWLVKYEEMKHRNTKR